MTDINTLIAIINTLPEHLPPDPARDRKISRSAKVSPRTSQILVGVFTAVATIAVAVRVMVHIHKRRRLFVDDYFVLFATACLLVETGILYHILDTMYVETMLAKDPMNIFLFTRSQVLELLPFLKWNNIYMSFAWTANYAIKVSFLAFFRVLLRDVSRRLNWYWWLVLWFTLASWAFNFMENFILCGASNNLKCYPYPAHNVEMAWTSTAADIITDLMIVSIPILLLRNARLQLSRKLRILAFLCLSLVMVGFAIGRLAPAFYRDQAGVLVLSLIWTHLWLHLESSVAVLMGGVTAFRTVFPRHTREEQGLRERLRGSGLYDAVRRILGKSGLSSTTKLSDEESNKKRFLSAQLTGGSLKGLRTFIRRQGREPGHTTVNTLVEDSTYDPLVSYHNFRRNEKASGAASGAGFTSAATSEQNYELPERPMPALQMHNLI